jgi:CheY-like chemotaxis protein
MFLQSSEVKVADLRRPRVLVFDDSVTMLNLLKHYFSSRGYEFFSFAAPATCPIYEANEDSCAHLNPCADVVLTDYHMPGINGVELLERQDKRGCKVNIRNKAIMSGNMTSGEVARTHGLGCALFKKPFTLSKLSSWLCECEKRMDLSRPVGFLRRETRHMTHEEIVYRYGPGDEMMRGTIVNISDSGLCLKVHTPLPSSQTILINTELSNCCLSGDVRWVRKAGNDLFMVGLNCS